MRLIRVIPSIGPERAMLTIEDGETIIDTYLRRGEAIKLRADLDKWLNEIAELEKTHAERS